MAAQEKYNIKCLIVEDDLSSLTFIEALLNRIISDVYTASNGEMGVERYNEIRPELIISDVGMPILNGLEMAERIKAINSKAHIILTTAFDNKELLLKAIDIGIFEYIVKPVNKEKLYKSVERAAERITLEKEIAKQNESILMLYRAVENISNILMILDKNGTIEYINPKFDVLTGDNSKDIIGNHISDFPPDDISISSFNRFLENLKLGKEWKGEWRRVKKDGSKYWVQVSLSPVINDDNILTHFIMVHEDISYQKLRQEELSKLNDMLEARVNERTAELEKAKNIAEAANSAKSMFLAKVSHELRTPMNGIIGMTSILLQNQYDTKTNNALLTIKSSADLLLTIINDVLDISKIDSGKFKLDTFEFTPKSIFDTTIELLKNIAENKGLVIFTNYSDEIPKILIGDGNRFQQIINNLVGNAIKFTEKGFIKVDLTCYLIDNTNIRLNISVEDTGIGIDKNKSEELFESFTQLEDTMTRKYGGTGLGLSITKEIVQNMNGEIWYESEKDKGSVFHASFNMKYTNQTSLSVEQNTNFFELKFDKISRKVNLLIAEDSIINQEVISQILYDKNCNFHIANNGIEAIELYQKHNFDIILMDVQMPQMDGFQAANAIRAINNDRNINVPIVFITAHAGKESIAECYDNGADSVITKPFERDDIFKILFEFNPETISKSKINDLTNISDESLDANSESIPVNLTQLLVSINKKPEILSRIIEHFKKTIHNEIDIINELYNNQEYPELKNKIHKLKSELGHFGAEKARILCKNIENYISINDFSSLKSDLDNLLLEILKIIAYFEDNTIDSLLNNFS